MGIWSFWLILGVGFLIAEVFTLSATCLYIGIGAAAAMLCALLGGGWMATIVTFVAATVILYLVSFHWRTRLMRCLHKGTAHSATGMDALIGRTGTVYQSHDCMRMRIDGDYWQVRPARHEHILISGEEVKVVGYDSIILTVEPISSN